MRTRFLFLGLAAASAAVSSAQSLWDISLVGVTNVGDPGGIHTLAYQDSSTGNTSAATLNGANFTGLDGNGNSQTMSFAGQTVTSAQYGRLHCYTSGSLANSYYNAANPKYWDPQNGQPMPGGSPDSLTSLGFAGFNDILQFGGELQNGYRARYIFHVDGDNLGTGGGADMAFQIDSNPAESFFAFNGGHTDTIWATQSYEVNGITPQTVSVQFSNQVVFDTPALADGSNVWGTSNFGATLVLDHIEMVDSNGHPVSGWTVDAASGTHYSTVPEPASLAVFAAGLLALRRRRR